MDRVTAYTVVRSLLPPGPASVIDFDCRDGRGRQYLGETTRYLGLERSRVSAPLPGADVRSGFDWLTREDVPGGFDAAVCLHPPREMKVSEVAWRMGQSINKDGKVIVGLTKLPGVSLNRYFRGVTLYESGGVMLAECRGLKNG